MLRVALSTRTFVASGSPQLPHTYRLPAIAKSAMSSGPGSVHGHSDTSVPADADLKAAAEGESQDHGSGGPMDVGASPNPSSDPVHGHSGSSVPQDADVKAAKHGEPQFEGSGQPVEVSSLPNQDSSTSNGV